MSNERLELLRMLHEVMRNSVETDAKLTIELARFGDSIDSLKESQKATDAKVDKILDTTDTCPVLHPELDTDDDDDNEVEMAKENTTRLVAFFTSWKPPGYAWLFLLIVVVGFTASCCNIDVPPIIENSVTGILNYGQE